MNRSALQDRYVKHILEGMNTSKHEKIAFSILHDLVNRKGLRQGWEILDSDTKDEILRTWISIIKNNL